MLLRKMLLTCAAGLTLLALTAQQPLTPPGAFLPHSLGQQFTPHHLLHAYFESLAAQAPGVMRLEKYGYTYEDRPLQVAIFSSPDNMARLEDIRLNNLRLAGREKGAVSAEEPIAIVWLSMSVHGNEPSGSECSMELAYRLAAQEDADIRQWLSNTVVILDPSLNPDGYDRYTHWYRMSSTRLGHVDPFSREHREPWPRGRTNHYYFDLNRDWAWATQAETQQRLALYQKWLPHIHADLHEQYVDNPYYFAPAAEPMHEYITPWQKSFQTVIGKNHATYFDRNGWLYFTKEFFDLFYPSYGDTYPLFNGAIGMTYEQAGHSTAGRAVLTGTGDTLKLSDRIEHHLTTSLSTIESASKHATELTSQFRKYFRDARENPPGAFKTYLVSAKNPPNTVDELCRLLDRHHIQYGLAGQDARVADAFSYQENREQNLEITPDDLLISASQPHAVLLQVLFDPESRLSDSMTYDITAWALPYAFGLETYGLKKALEPRKPREPYRTREAELAAKPYAWCLHRESMAANTLMARLTTEGVRVRYATKAFTLADQSFEPGALVITRADNRQIDDQLDAMVTTAANEANIQAHPIFTGYADRGRDLGSDAFALLRMPEVAIVFDDGVDENAFGHIWYFMEQQLEYPVAHIAVRDLSPLVMERYNTLVFPDGSYRVDDSFQDNVRDWIRSGGRVIALEGALRLFAGEDGFALNKKSKDGKDGEPGSDADPLPYAEKDRDQLGEQTPGAVLKCRTDNSHPLAFGLPESYFTLKTSSTVYEMPSAGAAPVWIDKGYTYYGFIGNKLKKQLEKTPVLMSQKMGKGDILYFTDPPLFRGMWPVGRLLFANALFH